MISKFSNGEGSGANPAYLNALRDMETENEATYVVYAAAPKATIASPAIAEQLVEAGEPALSRQLHEVHQA